MRRPIDLTPRTGVMACGAGCALLLAAVPLGAQLAHVGAPSAGALRPVTVTDSIEMTLLGDSEARHFGTSPAVFSPDRRQFVVVSQRGNVAANSNEFALLWFTSDQAFGSPVPRVLAAFTSRSNRPGISNVLWRDDDTLLLLATDDAERRQVYSVDVHAARLERQTRHVADVTLFAAAPDRQTLVYFARPPLESVWSGNARHDGLLITGQRLADLLIGHPWPDDDAGVATPYELYVQASDAAPRRLSVPQGWLLVPGAAFISIARRGEYAILKCRGVDRERWPAPWREYDRQSSMAYFIVNLASGEWRPLLDAPAPASYTPDVFWLDDARVVLANVYLPLADSTGEERRVRSREVFTVEMDVRTRVFTRIVEGRHELAHDLMTASGASGDLLLRPVAQEKSTATAAGRVSLRAFRKRAGRWVRSDSSADARRAARQLAIEARQDMNTPPRLVAVDGESGRTATLLDPNPQFGGLRFGKVSQISWTGTDGLVNSGGLILPPDSFPGLRLPLVIQTHGWSARKFEIDGKSGNAGYAAQALAGRGIVVAQLSDEPARWDGSVEESRRAMATIDGIIEQLSGQGLIDLRRVGIQGWSRTGLHVRHVLTFSRHEFAAALIVDAMEASYGQYLAWLNQGSAAVRIYEGLNGGRPFGEGLQAWMRNATGFNLDRVRTPVRSLAFRHGFTLLSEWEWFTGLKYLGVPVELIWMPDAAHAPVRPRERLVAQQGAVDWFCFWLQGQEDPDPDKAEQYARWREMRAAWTGRQATSPLAAPDE